jgi:histidinol dehydrogenase
MKIIDAEDLGEKFFDNSESENIDSVREILKNVKANGDVAVREYNQKFDKLDIINFQLTKEDIKKAYQKVDKDTITALKFAASNIKKFAEHQLRSLKDFEINNDGVILGQRIVPIEKVGCYVPGGRYPLPSTALMTVIPAKVAGVGEVIICSPKISPVTIVAADIAGADKIFNVGGVQAIGAMAYGTKLVPKVDKIVGPGNQYVAAAKKEVYGLVGIDFIAGPSEVLVIADENGNPDFIAADLLAQAEHDPSSRAEVITFTKDFAEKISNSVEKQLSILKTKEVAKPAIDKNGTIILVNNMDEAIEIANKRAPEHLELQIKNPDAIIPQLKNYGSLFIGEYSAEVFGDYCSGPNHTLPTNGCARYTGGLSVKEYVKVLTFQKVTEKASAALIKAASKLADVEGLYGHKNAADIRLKK